VVLLPACSNGGNDSDHAAATIDRPIVAQTSAAAPTSTAAPATTHAAGDRDGDGIGDMSDDDIDGDGVINKDDKNIYEASVGAKPSTTTISTPPLPPMDSTTVSWWLANPALHDVGCSVGFEAVSADVDTLDESTYRRLCDGEQVLTRLAPTGGPPLTIEELDAIISKPAAAWMTSPSPATFDDIARAARSVVEGDRSPPAIVEPQMSANQVMSLLTALTAYPGSDLSVVNALDGLRGAAPSIPPVLRSGTFRVDQDIQPGSYRTVAAVEDCYWETLDEAGEINDNNFTTAPQVIMTVSPNDFAVNIEDCGVWVRVS
jgi:hypothetical protein